MISAELFFKNHFNDVKIINARLEVFTGDTIGKLTAGNAGGIFDTVLSRLATSYPAFTGNVSDVDVALNLQKGSTMTVEGVHKLFKVTMSAQEPFIANALGGKSAPAYLTFYPRKITEYSKCAQKDMTLLTTRVAKAATINATALGDTLATLLQGFKPQWADTKTAQELAKGDVSSERDDRSDTRIAIEKDLCYAIDIIASSFPGDVEKCSSFVDFKLLVNVVKRKHITKSGTILITERTVPANKSFTSEDKINIKNTSDNATIKAAIVLHPDDEPTLFVLVKPGKSFNKSAALLGSLTGTYLILINMSAVNSVTYVVEFME